MKENDIAVAYRCPACSEAVFGPADAIINKSGKIKLKCACGGSALEAEKDKDGKITLSVPCIFCEDPHECRLEAGAVASGRFFQVGCPKTGLPFLFAGPAKTVSDAVEKNEKDIKHIAEEAGIDLSGGVKAIDRTAITERLLRILGDLKAQGRIICSCENGKGENLSAAVGPDGVEIKCKVCGEKRFFRALSTLDCEYLSDIDLLYLE